MFELPVDDVGELPATVEGKDGVKVVCVLSKHWVTAEFSADAEPGAAELIVAFPPKLQDWGLRFVAS